MVKVLEIFHLPLWTFLCPILGPRRLLHPVFQSCSAHMGPQQEGRGQQTEWRY